MTGKSSRGFCLFSVAAASVAGSAPAVADYAFNLPSGVTPISHEAYRLHMLAFWICVGIAVVVFGAMLWAIVHHRKSRGAVPAQFHENTRLEIVWTVIPFLVLVVLAVPATRALMAMDDTKDADLTIKVTGQQWRWRYDYLNEGVGFFSNVDPKSVDASKRGSGIDPASVDNYLREVDQPLVLPVGKKIRFLFTATDVIHAWWVPALGYQVDANPGFISESWARIEQPGTYRGQCSELCGVGHAYMPIVLVAMNEPEFDAWLAQQKALQAKAATAAERMWTKDELYAKGQEVYGRICAACHQPNGQGIPGVFPALNGSPIATGPIAGHLNRVMNGKPGTAMQAFATQLSDVEIAGVITYERNTWGNKTGDVVQPAQVKQARK
ncbi:MAG: cytochrome c oxidase subunit II [Rhodocyclaceae bacterium]|nr:cytochrome c oxidase subunit II [Rhodocyclaceae bacterium]